MFRFLARAELKGAWFSALTMSSFVLMGFMGLIAVLLLILDLVNLLTNLKNKFLKKNVTSHSAQDHSKLSRRNFLKNNFTVATVVGGGAITGLGFANSFDPKIVPVSIPLKANHQELKGLKIVQLSDIHIGPTLKSEFAKMLVEKVNGLNPDLIVITGDMIDGRVNVIGEDLLPFKDFKSKLGTYFVTGNHEYYWNSKEWCEYAQTLGMKVLSNENAPLSYNNNTFYIAGVTDISSRKYDQKNACDPVKAMVNIPSESFKVLLSHQPKTCFETAKLKYDVQLSGHTHGGQGFPWNFIVYLVQPYIKGLHKVEDMHLYVSSGTGFWGPPNRFMVNSEITEITFV